MSILFALIIGIIVVEGVLPNSKKTVQNKTINQTTTDKTIKTKLAVPEFKIEPNAPEVTKTEVILKPKELEVIKTEAKPEVKKPAQIKQEAKIESKEPELVKNETQLAPVEEEIKKIENFNDPGTEWLKLVLYVLGALLVIGSGTYFYKRIKNNAPSGSSNDYMRRKFKEETQAETIEEQPAEENENNNK